MTDHTTDRPEVDDPRVLALAKARQEMAYKNPFNVVCPPWDGLTEQEQHLSLLDARNYLRAALNAGLVPVAPPADRDAAVTAAPVKQRADCTEIEWAEQERARFERLYTREYTRAEQAEDLLKVAHETSNRSEAERASAVQRADTAARDADIYRERLERLGEGYTRERKRAERAEAEAERLRTYRDATCICQHTEQQHFEDACLMCACGDYLPPAAARDVIARYQGAVKQETADQAADAFTAADLVAALRSAGEERDKLHQKELTELRRKLAASERIRENADFHLGQEMGRRQLAEKETARLSADRAAVLRAAAQHLYTALFPAVYDDMGQKAAEGVQRAVSELRRLADVTPAAEAQPEPPERNFAAYQAAIVRVALVLREAREHREQTDPSERQDCVMCGADHFAEIRDAIKGKQPAAGAEHSPPVQACPPGCVACATDESHDPAPAAGARQDGAQPQTEAAVPVHAIPLPGSNGISSCCGRPPCEFVGERVTRDPSEVTCQGAQ